MFKTFMLILEKIEFFCVLNIKKMIDVADYHYESDLTNTNRVKKFTLRTLGRLGPNRPNPM